ncbi:hypothetical protein Tco_0890286 [Tanacetum coccineum]|uniref:Reverse transcriptase Ty1/copia-type domain-containing protein n=1 Tax=Tanacetum coccineum TaxID=301880 RepID=A0ABQ5C5J1_9ASTR
MDKRSSLEQVRGKSTKPVQTKNEAATDPEMSMQDELHQFDRLKVWELVDKPFGKMIIKLKWLWKNKKDEDQDCARLGSSSDFRCPRSNTSSFPIYQMDVKTAFLNGPLKEEQAPRAWYDELSNLPMPRGLKLKRKSFKETSDPPVPKTRPDALILEKHLSGGIQFLGEKLVSWMSKETELHCMSSAEADNVALSASYIVQDDEVAIDAIPLATKPPMIVEYKIDKEGKMGYFKLIRADGSSKRYSSMIQMLQGIDREDLETLQKLVKAKHGLRSPEEDYERVLWGDLKVMFEPDVESKVWRNLQGYNVTVWKLFSSSGVHFVRFQNMHIFMLVEKKYPLTPTTITKMLNKKLQTDQWDEMCY